MKKKIPPQVKLIKEHKLPKITREDSNISYSQFYSYQTCPHQWYLTYVKKLALYTPSIHTVFGTAMHETIQDWVTVMYEGKVKDAMNMDLDALLETKMFNVYKQEKARSGHEHFSTPEELNSFYQDGKLILEYLKKNRSALFGNTRDNYLVGTEVPLLVELKPSLFFKGYIDLIFYNEISKKYYIVDFKTSTSGWNDYAKKDEKKVAQLVLYKEFFSKQFGVGVESIDIEYVILKRKVPVNAEFASMSRRVQSFIPPSGKIKSAYYNKELQNFIDNCFDDDGNHIEKDYLKNASKSSCNFCQFKDNKFLCSQAVL